MILKFIEFISYLFVSFIVLMFIFGINYYYMVSIETLSSFPIIIAEYISYVTFSYMLGRTRVMHKLSKVISDKRARRLVVENK